MKYIKWILLFSFIILSSACSTIKSQHVIGSDIYKPEKKDWDGSWFVDDDFLKIKVLDVEKGIIKVMFIDNDELDTHTILLRRNNDNLFGNILDKDNTYFFGKFIKRKNIIVFWLPSYQTISKAIKAKKLTGTEKDKDIFIKSDSKSLNNFFSGTDFENKFEYQDPMVLFRISKE